MRIAVLGVDLGKNVCSLVGLDDAGVVVVRRRARRDTLINFVSKLPACIGDVAKQPNQVAAVAGVRDGDSLVRA